MKPIDVIIFGGQSNMQGQTEKLLNTPAPEGVWEYRLLTDELVPVMNPTGENIRYDGTAGYPPMQDTDLNEWLRDHVLGSACYGNTSMIPAFCREYAARTGVQVVAVPAAKGSTEIVDWLPGTDGYQMLVKKAQSALRKAAEVGEIRHVYLAWLQGESDAIFRRTKDDYKVKIAQLAEALQAEVGLETFGVIRIGRFMHDERDWEIIHAQDEICREHELFRMLTDIAVQLNEDARYMNPFVKGHFGAEGLEHLGRIAAKALADHAK